VKKLCQKMNWAECPRCHVFIERTAGYYAYYRHKSWDLWPRFLYCSCLLITCFCGCMFCYNCKSVALSQYSASCSCQPGHRFLSLAELGRDSPYPTDGSGASAPAPSYYETLDENVIRNIERTESRSKSKGWSSFRKKIKLGLLGLTNGLVGIVLFKPK